MSFGEILGTLTSCPGTEAAALLDSEGQMVAEGGRAEAVEVLGAYQAVWLGDLGRATEMSGIGGIREMVIDFAGQRLVTATVGDEGYFLLVLLRPDSRLAEVRRRLPRVRELLLAEIG